MEKIISPTKKCKCCGNVKEYEKKIEICDNCNKELDWNSKSGYPFKIDPLLHDESMEKKQFHFCSFECGVVWTAENHNPLYEEDDFISIYYHKEDWDKLIKIFQDHFTQVTL